MQTIPLSNDFFEGVIDLRQGDGWIQPLRLVDRDRPLYHEAFVERAVMSGGCRLRFRTDATTIQLTVEPESAEAPRLFDLTTDDARLATATLAPQASAVRFESLPAGDKVLELWFPTHRETRIRGLAVDDGARLEPAPDRRPRWITYGSSITHCAAAHSPSRTWPAVAARLRGLNVTSLGYGGQCHMDTLVARIIRDRPAAFISLKLGINMMGATATLRTYRPQAIAMVRLIREKHPRTPIALVSPIISPPREETPGTTGMTLRIMRQELEAAVDRLRQCGDNRVFYVDGLKLFGPDLVADYLPDLLHPNGDGYEIMGRHAATHILDRLMAI